ncbi:MAG: type II/IV secretion system protein [Magnetococcales bacterium]|nr:type II/IV secretion system protein [Magnetococcales bacterium]
MEKILDVRIQSILCVPILSGPILVGIIQIYNRFDGDFVHADPWKAKIIADFLGQKFRYEMAGTSSPFEQLVLSKKIDKKRLAAVLTQAEQQEMAPSRLLTGQEDISSWDVGRSLERFYQTTWVGYDPDRDIPQDLVQGLNKKWMAHNRFVPIGGNRKLAEILIDDPSDVERILEIERHLGAHSYIFRVGLEEDIERYLSSGQVLDRSFLDELQELEKSIAKEVASLEFPKESPLDQASQESLVSRIINQLIILAKKNRGSDLHLIPQASPKPMSVKLRVDGVCQHLTTLPAILLSPTISRIKVLASLDITERRTPQDGKIFVKINGVTVEMRVAILPTVHGESAVLRFSTAAHHIDMDMLDLTPDNFSSLEKLIRTPHGLILTAGPTGSGKTTTLHALLKRLNSPDKVIWTVEDPVEIIQDGLRQVQTNSATGLDFSKVLRSLLRADPDVVMVGEMRDLETAQMAVKASLTGHLVLSTLHANSAVESITRLMDMGLDSNILADSLLGIISQRLVRLLCSNCKTSIPPTPLEFRFMNKNGLKEVLTSMGLPQSKPPLIYKASGCNQCNFSGYKKRTALYELFVNSSSLRQMIRLKESSGLLRQAVAKQGQRTMPQDGLIKMLQGKIDFQELTRVAVMDS